MMEHVFRMMVTMIMMRMRMMMMVTMMMRLIMLAMMLVIVNKRHRRCKSFFRKSMHLHSIILFFANLAAQPEPQTCPRPKPVRGRCCRLHESVSGDSLAS